MKILSNRRRRFSSAGIALAATLVCGFTQAMLAAPASAQAPSVTEIRKYLIVGFKKSSEGDAVNLQNGEFGADREVLSDGGSSSTGASFPTLQSVFDQRWSPNGNERYLVHPISGDQVAPEEDYDWSGNIALTSSSGRMSASDTDLYADLGAFDASLAGIGIVAAKSGNPFQSVSSAAYFAEGDPPGSPEGNLNYPNVGVESGVDLSGLKSELEAWKRSLKELRTKAP